jgi:hypothetical protein
MDSLLMQVAQGGIAFSILVAAILYFLKREKKKDKEIEDLNTLLREVEKENLTALYKVLNYLEKAQEKDNLNFSELKRDIDEMRKSIEGRLNTIKNV